MRPARRRFHLFPVPKVFSFAVVPNSVTLLFLMMFHAIAITITYLIGFAKYNILRNSPISDKINNLRANLPTEPSI